MWAALTQRLTAATDAPGVLVALRRVGEYLALRLWVVIIGCFPIEMNLRTARLMGRIWWALKRNHRDRAMDNLRPALGDRCSETQLRRIARLSFEHFAQLYLVELAMTPRMVTEWSWARHVELDHLGPALQQLLASRGTILLTGHFGNYELLGYTICRLGIPLTAVMRPVDNPLISHYLEASRAAGGLSLLHKKGVTAVAGDVIDRGGALCFIADQDAGRKGLFVDFFGRRASTYKSIGLLAMQKRVPVVIGYAARIRRGFHYRIAVERIIQPAEWESQDDPLRWITQTYTSALEAAVRRWPEQYLWVHRRWKHRPKEERGTAIDVVIPPPAAPSVP
jgi:Kdo2-lipid IVA lauroyltransferase/acyltransferase